MINSFAGLEMSRRAMNAFQLGMKVAGHNVTNSSTVGFSRQRVNLSTTTPFTAPGLASPVFPGQIGTGVKADEIVRIRDQFLDFQFRAEMSALGYWNKINRMYNTVQLFLAEPAGNGVRAGMDAFWETVLELQKNPESSAIRRAMVESAKTLGGLLDNVIRGLDDYVDMLNREVQAAVGEINGMLHDVASLNRQIHAIKAAGQNPNDLLDKRDLLLDRLSYMIDIDIQEPFRHGNVTGEFFITLNGRTLVQGDNVRELVARPFFWNDKVYFDVQVRDNEFDIVEDTNITWALATGPEGVHQLNVLRLANGEQWRVGGEDPWCIITTELTSREFVNGVILGPGATDGENRIFTVSAGGESFTFTVTWDDGNNEWVMTNNRNGTIVTSAANELTVNELVTYMQSVFDDLALISPPWPAGLTITATPDAGGNFFTITADTTAPTPVEITLMDQSGLLGMRVTGNATLESFNVSMRVRPSTTTEPLGLASGFRIQVGTQGTQVTSRLFNTPGLTPGDILAAWQPGELTRHTFRIGAHDYQIDVTVEWDSGSNSWVMTTDTGAGPVMSTGGLAGERLTVEDLGNFLQDALSDSRPGKFAIGKGTPPTVPPRQFSIASTDNFLISITDVTGNLADRMGMANPNPIINIDIEPEDCLETIRNKINEKFQAEFGLTQPEQWVHAELQQAGDHTWYLVFTSNVPGEAQRITLMGDEDGNTQTLRRLGLVTMEQIVGPGGSTIYREVTAFSRIAEDAHFTFNGVSFLSADNKFEHARRIPAGDNRNDFSASRMEAVSEGIFLHLRGIGRTTINVEHHVRDGSIKAMRDIRDGLIPRMRAELDDLAWAKIINFNAFQFAGYGIGGNINTTGVAFFDQPRFRSGAAANLRVNSEIDRDITLIGAAMGRLDANGRATSGVSSGSGGGTNAARMASLATSKLLNNGTASLGDFYEAFLARIGSEAGRAALMFRAQRNMTEQIDLQRQAVMGVNVDEEMLDILRFNHAFNAMARYATTIDEMLDRIINSFGIVGR